MTAEAHNSLRNDRGSAGSVGASAASEKSPRAPTFDELSRELEVRQRELEDLVIGIGDGEATEAQRERIRRLGEKIAELRSERDRIANSEVFSTDDETLPARWARFRSAFRDITSWDLRDGMLRFQIGIRAQIDATLGTQDAAIEDSFGTIENGLALRRGRVFAKGRLLRAFDFWLEYDLGEDVAVKNAYIDGRQISRWVADRFRWRVGLFQEPFSIARTTSSFHTGFMEVALPVDALAPGHNTGIMFRHAENNDRITWATSVMTNGRTTDDNPNNSRFTVTGRVTGLPLLADDGRRLVHVGVSFSDRQPTGNDIRYRARPEARSAPFYADTGVIVSDRVQLLGIELGVVHGSNWLQAEWIGSAVDAPAAGNPRFAGAYVEVGRFLTGEQRPYDRIDGAFGRVVPGSVYRGGNPFRLTGRRGAFEITARYSEIDLNDEGISGGRMRDTSLGLNWHMNDVSRVTLNYVRSDMRGVGASRSVLLRFQYNP